MARQQGYSSLHALAPVSGDAVPRVVQIFASFVILANFANAAPRQSNPEETVTLDSSCVINILNRTTMANDFGGWHVPNVPASLGPMRARAACIGPSGVTVGQSELFTLAPGEQLTLQGGITFATPVPKPESVSVTTPTTVFTAVGEMAQLVFTATHADGTVVDVTDDPGTLYTTSNPAIATVGNDGLVTAQGVGNVVVGALYEQVISTVLLSVQVGDDSDGDGMPDAFEITNGLDPYNPLDALMDADGDGLSNLNEFLLATLVNGVDTDGDLVSDGLEVLVGTDPTDPQSVDWSLVIDTLTVEPQSVVLVVNTVLTLQVSRQLLATATLLDGRIVDVTGLAVFSSSNLQVVSPGVEPGRIYAGDEGDAQVTAALGGFSAITDVVVQHFSPTGLARIELPGEAQDVTLDGDLAYVSSGSAGLLRVDITDVEAPFLVTAIDTPGTARAATISGGEAYVADGLDGLRIIRLSDDTLVGFVDTPGEAMDVVVRDGLAYIADRTAGLQVVDVSVPSSPQLIGSVETPGEALGLDVVGSLALVADRTGGLRVIDVSNPTSPVELGWSPTRTGGSSQAAAVVASGQTAYVADGANAVGGLRILDFANPSAPRLLGSSDDQFRLNDLALEQSIAVTSDVNFGNAVPLFDVGGGTPIFRDTVDFTQFGDGSGTGIAVRLGVVYLTARTATSNGFYVGRFMLQLDTEGVAPEIEITEPLPNAQFAEGSQMLVRAAATDDIGVASVEFFIDGVPHSSVSVTPYETAVSLPMGAATLLVEARAVDYGGNLSELAAVTVELVPDPLTTVTGVVVDQDGYAVVGASATVRFTGGGPSPPHQAWTDQSGLFEVQGVPTRLGDLSVDAQAAVAGGTMFGNSTRHAPVGGGTTNVGTITLFAPGTALYGVDLSGLVLHLQPETGDLTYEEVDRGAVGAAFDDLGRLFVAGMEPEGAARVADVKARGADRSAQWHETYLIEIDPDTGLDIALLGAIQDGGVDVSVGDLAFQPGAGVLFGISDSPPGLLYTIDLVTAQATLVGDTATGAAGGLAFTSDGTLFLVGDGGLQTLYSLDPTSAAVLSSVPLTRDFVGLGSSADRLFGLAWTDVYELVAIEPDGSETLIAEICTPYLTFDGDLDARPIELPMTDVVGIAIAPSGQPAATATVSVRVSGRLPGQHHGLVQSDGSFTLLDVPAHDPMVLEVHLDDGNAPPSRGLSWPTAANVGSTTDFGAIRLSHLLGGYDGSLGFSGNLMLLDETTGDRARLGDSGRSGGIDGLGFSDEGRLFVVASSGTSSELVELDPDTLVVIASLPIMASGAGISIADVSFQPGTGQLLFAIRDGRDGQGQAGKLYTIDVTTGAASEIGDTGESEPFGLAFVDSGTLFLAVPSPDRLLSLDLTDGLVLSTTTITRSGCTGSCAIGGLPALGARLSDGALFGFSDRLWSIDPVTGSATQVGSIDDCGSIGDLDFRR